MLHYLLTPLSEGGGFFNLFNYITFRAGGAFFTALLFGFLFGRPIIDLLRHGRLLPGSVLIAVKNVISQAQFLVMPFKCFFPKGLS